VEIVRPPSRLIPPEPGAVRAARGPARPRRRGLGLLACGAGMALAVGLLPPGAALPAPAAGTTAARGSQSGILELAAAAPLRAIPGREAEVQLRCAWEAAAAPGPAERDEARRALVRWIAARRPAELDGTVPNGLETALEAALFTGGEGRLTAIAIREIRLR
jgi:hypothetical protein